MTTLKKGYLIKNQDGETQKILEVCGEILFISYYGDKNKYGFTSDEPRLKDLGYTWDTPAWKPALWETYWYIDGLGQIVSSIWQNHQCDHARIDLLGTYQTKELAKAALLEIRRKLGK